jgi:hypothetical protein
MCPTIADLIVHTHLGSPSIYSTMRNLSLKESILHQPPSFSKKKMYEIHDVLGEGSYGQVMVKSHINPNITCTCPNRLYLEASYVARHSGPNRYRFLWCSSRIGHAFHPFLKIKIFIALGLSSAFHRNCPDERSRTESYSEEKGERK